MAEERVRIEIDDHVAVVTLARPEKHNALDLAMFEAIGDVLERLAGERGVRAVVLHGEGPSFCSGLDAVSVMSTGEGLQGLIERLREDPPNWFQRVAFGWTQLPMPVIAAVHGTCFGGGLQIALAADIRIAADTAKLAPVFTRRGVLPESGGTWYLPRLLGWARAAEVAFTGRVLEAKECLDLGLVNQVVGADGLMEAIRAMASEIVANAPLAVQATKRLMRLGLDETFEANVDHVFSALVPLFLSQDFREGMAAYLQRRPPHFEGR